MAFAQPNVNAGEFLDLAGFQPDGVPQLRDDDLSIPVLAEVLEPGDPAKADPAIPRPPVEHAWTDAVMLDTHSRPLAAVPTLSDVLVEGDPGFSHPSPLPADAPLTIPLLTDVMPYRDAVADLSRDETHGAPIPMLTDRFDEPASPVLAKSTVEPVGDAAAAAQSPLGLGDFDDIPVLTDLAVDEEAIPELTDRYEHADDIPVLSDIETEAHDIPVLDEVLGEAHDIPVLHEVAGEAHDIPVLDEVVGEAHDIPVLHEVAGEAHDIPVLDEVVGEAHDIPVLHEVAGEAHDIPVLDEVVGEAHDIPVLHEVVGEAHDIPVLHEVAGETHDIPVLEEVVGEAHEIPALHEVAGEAHDIPVLDEVEAYAHLPAQNDDHAALDELTHAELSESSAHTIPDLQALASSIDAQLFDPEVPFRAYCAFPGEKAVEPLLSGESDVPDAYPMARVPQPFGSASDELAVPPTDVTDLDTSVTPAAQAPEFEAPPSHEAMPKAVLAPDSADSSAVEVHPVPFEAIAATPLPEPEQPPVLVDAADLDTRDFGDHEPHLRIETPEPVVDHVEPDLRDFGVLPEHAEASIEAASAALEVPEALHVPEALEAPEALHIPEATEAPEALHVPEAVEVPEALHVSEAVEVPEALHVPEALEVPEPLEVAEAHGSDTGELESAFSEPPFTTSDADAEHDVAMEHDTHRHDAHHHDGSVTDAGANASVPGELAFAELEFVDQEPEHTEAVAAEHGAVMAEEEADHVAAMLSRREPVAAELTVPEPEPLASAVATPSAADLERVASEVGERALRFLSGEGHTLIEERCQEQAVWLAHRITREIAASLEREIGQWVQQAIKDAVLRRDSSQ